MRSCGEGAYSRTIRHQGFLQVQLVWDLPKVGEIVFLKLLGERVLRYLLNSLIHHLEGLTRENTKVLFANSPAGRGDRPELTSSSLYRNIGDKSIAKKDDFIDSYSVRPFSRIFS